MAFKSGSTWRTAKTSASRNRRGEMDSRRSVLRLGHTRYEDVVDLAEVVDASEETESFLGALVVTPLELAEPA